MSYRRDFTIGWKETRDFYLSLALGHWWKGFCGFGVAGALAAVMYTFNAGLTPLARGALALGAGALVAAAGLAVVAGVTTRRVKRQVRQAGRETYVQETEINGFGIRVTVGKDKARLAFENLVQVRETGRAFYLFLSADQAWILPKAQMEDPAAECARLRELFRAVVERRRLKLKK